MALLHRGVAPPHREDLGSTALEWKMLIPCDAQNANDN